MPVLHGLETFEAKLKTLQLSVQKKMLAKVAKKGAELIRAEAEARAPRDTGKLAEQEISVQVSSESTASEVIVRIGPARSAFYGMFQEFGTAHHAKQPFLFPAFEAKKDEALQLASDEFRQAVERA